MYCDYQYFWSYDTATGAWRNEAAFMNGGNASNLPCSRSEFPVVTLEAEHALVFSGYTTNVPQTLPGNLMMQPDGAT